MATIRLTKAFHFEMGHALYGYDGPCKNIHGHSYCLELTVIGKVKPQKGNPKDGMLIDFTVLKKIVHQTIIDPLDHALVLNGKSPHRRAVSQSGLTGKSGLFNKIVWMDVQPTCENLLIHFAEKLKPLLPAGVKLHRLYLRETPSSYAEWFAEDN